MKTTCWWMLAFLVSTGLMAQELTNAPAAPALGPTNEPAATPVPIAEEPTKPAPVAKPPPKKAPAKKSATASKTTAARKTAPRTPELRTVPLIPGPATVVANNVNVRGQAKLRSEVVARLGKGQPVTVIEEIVLKNTAADEPSAWAKIRLPEGTNVWVSNHFVDPTNKTVIPKLLNVRSGPGENYSVLGQLARGEVVKEVASKGDWIGIEAPTNAYAFVAAQYLKQDGSTLAEVAAHSPSTGTNQTPIAEPPPTTTAVTEAPAIAAAPGTAPELPATTPADTNIVATATPAEPSGEVEMQPEPEEVLPPRIVQREGIVRGTGSIQAPTHFALVSPDTRRLINYLYTSSPLLDLTRYKGMRITVTGEEYMDERWGNTPVIAIQKIDVMGE